MKFIPKTATSNLPFNQNNFFRCHSIKVLPLVILAKLDSHYFAFAVRINESYWEHVLFNINASIITEGQRPVYGRMSYRSPEVDNLEAPFKQFWSVGGGEMSVDSSDG